VNRNDDIFTIVSSENVEAYAYLFAIEVGLRELIIERLNHLDGRNWYKARLPSDVLKDYKDGVRKERATPITQFVHHDPIYYVDFPALSKVMNTGQNWRDAFQELFGTKEIFLGSLKSLESTRNKVAHNRKITGGDLALVHEVFRQIESVLGREKLCILVARCSNADGALERLKALQIEARRCVELCLSCAALPERSVWQEVESSPWLGMLTVNVEFDKVISYFELLACYASLPSSMYGYQIEQWAYENRIDDMFRRADQVLARMIDEVSHG